ncbi:hypothetical protein [Acuticoccus mangrovi]|uniref:Uncharacterized protein n=1 Tax=Acuticoccus mangrovi TaxID=2796142 RepID=A0A934IPV8_9HYPH|nr:hypothetical protein [Acuticoccus mangrovi]MBJ3778831.1 hypothetical protein [Acuticoccus mangrovi]
MGSDVQKFTSKRFLANIDLDLMRALFARHFADGDSPVAFDGNSAGVRAALTEYFHAPVTDWSEGMIADLHRVKELGKESGLQLILGEARRQGIVLYSDAERADDAPPTKYEAKHVALYTYLNHPSVFEAAADFQALRAPTAMAEFRGPDRDADADLTEETTDALKSAIRRLLAEDLHGDFCRITPYENDDEISVVVSHGAPIKTMPVVAGDREEVIPIQAMKYATLRYSASEGLLRIGGVAKARQSDVAEAFATHILGRPGFFAGNDARDIYTLDAIAEVGSDFTFDHGFDERIREVRIVAATALLYERNEDEQLFKFVRSLESKDASGSALQHLRSAGVPLGRAWRLGEITFRVFFDVGAKRPAQVTVRLKPPGTLAFRRTRFEKAIHTLVARNGLEVDRDAFVLVEAAE